MSYNYNKRKRHKEKRTFNDEPKTDDIIKVEEMEEVNDESVAELSAPEIYAKIEEDIPEDPKPVNTDPVEEALEEAITKVREYPTMLESPKMLERNQRRVKARSLRIRKEASRVANVIGLLKENDIILVDGLYKSDSWCKMIDENGNTKGYVMKDFVTPYA